MHCLPCRPDGTAASWPPITHPPTALSPANSAANATNIATSKTPSELHPSPKPGITPTPAATPQGAPAGVGGNVEGHAGAALPKPAPQLESAPILAVAQQPQLNQPAPEALIMGQSEKSDAQVPADR